VPTPHCFDCVQAYMKCHAPMQTRSPTTTWWRAGNAGAGRNNLAPEVVARHVQRDIEKAISATENSSTSRQFSNERQIGAIERSRGSGAATVEAGGSSVRGAAPVAALDVYALEPGARTDRRTRGGGASRALMPHQPEERNHVVQGLIKSCDFHDR
jgi:hypothetical protein